MSRLFQRKIGLLCLELITTTKENEKGKLPFSFKNVGVEFLFSTTYCDLKQVYDRYRNNLSYNLAMTKNKDIGYLGTWIRPILWIRTGQCFTTVLELVWVKNHIQWIQHYLLHNYNYTHSHIKDLHFRSGVQFFMLI